MPVLAAAAIIPPGPSLNNGGAVTEMVMAADGSWIIAGTFTSVGGVPRNNLARILPDGTVDPNWAPNPDTTVETVAVSGGNVYFGGWFSCTGVVGAGDGDCTDVGELPRASIAMAPLSGNGAVDPTWNPGTSHIVQIIVPCGAYICVGGSFTQVNGGTPRSGLFRTLPTGNGTADPTWAPNTNDGVWALHVDGDDLYVGGNFTTINGSTARRRAARVSLTTGLADAWNPSVDATVLAIRPFGDSVFLGGQFESVNGGEQPMMDVCFGPDPWDCFPMPYGPRTHPLAYLAKAARDGAGAVDETWAPNPNDEVWGLSMSGGSLLVAGGFTSFMGGATPVARGRLAALSPATGEPGPWNPGLNGRAATLAKGNGMVATGGPFTQVGGAAAIGSAFLVASFPPAAPTGATASQPLASEASLDVSFTPGDDGNATPAYSATCTSSTGGVSGTSGGPASPVRVTGLTAGATYACVVSASNSAGPAADASAASPPVTLAEAPSAASPSGDTPAPQGPPSGDAASGASPTLGGSAASPSTRVGPRNRLRAARARRALGRAPLSLGRPDRGRLTLTGRFEFRERGRLTMQALPGAAVQSTRDASRNLCMAEVGVPAGRPATPRCAIPAAALKTLGGPALRLRVRLTFATRDGITVRVTRGLSVPATVMRAAVAVTG